MWIFDPSADEFCFETPSQVTNSSRGGQKLAGSKPALHGQISGPRLKLVLSKLTGLKSHALGEIGLKVLRGLEGERAKNVKNCLRVRTFLPFLSIFDKIVKNGKIPDHVRMKPHF